MQDSLTPGQRGREDIVRQQPEVKSVKDLTSQSNRGDFYLFDKMLIAPPRAVAEIKSTQNADYKQRRASYHLRGEYRIVAVSP